nr:hypothetical protein HK105_002779 [Polyrhizophydium stewartii]
MRLLLNDYPLAPLTDPARRLCQDHVQHALQARIDFLLEEDQSQFSRLQEDAIKNLKNFEIEQTGWLNQFELGRTIGQIAADAVARFGGSWGFLIALFAFLAAWMIINGILNAFGYAWDPYPFVLLNLALSTLAAAQAPIIMMSQNRQAERDRLQSNYVSEAILRNEHQTRLVDAKVDHLISNQWKRLLEIQEIQIHLLELQINHIGGGPHPNRMGRYAAWSRLVSSIGSPGQRFSKLKRAWTVEIQSDHLTKLLLRNYFDVELPGDTFAFSHWHEDGDNFTGIITDVSLDINDRKLSHITFTLSFGEQMATMDDVLSGEGTVHLRNDFNIPHMQHFGRIARIAPLFANGATATFNNGELPPRYKPAFARKRQDRITEIWKTHIRALKITYVTPLQLAMVDVDAGCVLRDVTVTIFPRTNGVIPSTDVYFAKDVHPDLIPAEKHHDAEHPGAAQDAAAVSGTAAAAGTDGGAAPEAAKQRLDDPVVYGRQIVGPRPLPEGVWKPMVHYDAKTNTIMTSEERRKMLEESRQARFREESATAEPDQEPRRPSLSRIHAPLRLSSFKIDGRKSTKTMIVGSPVAATASQSALASGAGAGAGAGAGQTERVSFGNGTSLDDVRLDSVIATAPVSIMLQQEFVGPATYLFLCDEARVSIHGDIEECSL